MSDIVLIYPKTGFDLKKVSIELPLAVIHAASFVHREGYKIQIIDQRLDDRWADTLARALESKPLLVGISAFTGTQIRYGLEAAAVVRTHPEIPIVWGGIHPSILPKQTLKSPYVDMVVKGEGEKTLSELAGALRAGTEKKDLSGIAGLCYKDGDQLIENPDRAPLDLANYPALPYDLVDVSAYLQQNGGMFSAVYSFGCPFACAFCCNPLLSKSKWRTFPTARIIEELDQVQARYHFKKLKFSDENFFVDHGRVEEISRAINARYEWEAQARIDSAAKFDYAALRARGLYQIQPGIESGNDRVLDLINKSLTVDKILAYNRVLSQTGIIATYNFVMGFPTETEAELYDSLDLAMRLLAENPRAEISAFYIYVPYPGCELFDFSVAQGFQPPNDLEGWACYHRQQRSTPWIQDKLTMLTMIVLTSKFIDGKRATRLFQKWHLPAFIPWLMGALYRRRWKQRDFKNHLDMKLLNLVVNRSIRIFN